MVVPNFTQILDQVFGIKGAAIKVLLVLVLVLALVAIGLGLHAKTLRLERDLSRATVADLSRVVDRVNREVAKWKDQADLQARAAELARDEAEEIRLQGERRIAALKAAQIPAGCAEAVRWGGDQVLLVLGGAK